jgi:hypothetical protein
LDRTTGGVFVPFERVNMSRKARRRRRLAQANQSHECTFGTYKLFVCMTPDKGRGVFAKVNIFAGDTIEICPVIPLSEADHRDIADTPLNDVVFDWPDPGQNPENEWYGCCVVLGFGSIYNHSPDSNADWYMSVPDRQMRVVALKSIVAGEQITIDYGWNEEEAAGIPWYKASY